MYSRFPIVVKAEGDTGYRGYWGPYSVGPSIDARWKAILSVIKYRLTGDPYMPFFEWWSKK